mgnify:CR=1 FL=1
MEVFLSTEYFSCSGISLEVESNNSDETIQNKRDKMLVRTGGKSWIGSV